MHIIQSRRDFITLLSAAGAADVLARTPLADEGPPETTTIRIRVEDAPPNVVGGVAQSTTCIAPLYITQDLLRTEGFTDVRYVPVKFGSPLSEAFLTGVIDLDVMFAPEAIARVDTGVPITALAGVHPGCFELFAHEPIRRVTEVKGKQVGINAALGSPDHLYVSIMAAHVGLDPDKDIRWITTDDVPHPKELFVQGKIDAYLAPRTARPQSRPSDR
jgi:NitT/TauT family transport system substrate-binding protein